ncbi:MAG: peptidyl-prolyl cis-trans isomerase [Candidatus Omnitrophica bacterium]|nr:peptidyl-prolyl cis-trans isomerase [Candidatus Omnitrophota bacterium]
MGPFQKFKYLLCAGLAVWFFSAAGARPAMAMDDAILAIVNEDVITLKDFQDNMKAMAAQLRIEGRTPDEIQEVMSKYEQKGIEQLIDDRLILNAANQSGLMLRPKAVDDRFDEIKKKYASYQEFLDSIRKEGLTITEIRKKIEDQFKGQIIINKEVRDKITVNPQEVTDFFETHKAELVRKPRVFLDTIFVKSDFGKEDAKKKIYEAAQKIKEGQDFKVVAGTYSDLPSVGEIDADQLRPELKEKIDLLSIGQVSDVVEVMNGFYLIRLEARSDGAEAQLKEVKDRIYEKLFEDKFRDAFKAWVEKLRKKAYVEIKK